jgi:hypothetical protein
VCAPRFGTHMTRWKELPLKCRGLPMRPMPFSPAQVRVAGGESVMHTRPVSSGRTPKRDSSCAGTAFESRTSAQGAEVLGRLQRAASHGTFPLVSQLARLKERCRRASHLGDHVSAQLHLNAAAERESDVRSGAVRR